jgi:hypothetical protein
VELKVEEFNPIVQYARSFTTDSGPIPSTSYLYFKGRVVSACGEGAGVSLTLPVEFPAVTVNAAMFAQQIASLRERGEETVTIDIEEGKRLKLKSGKARSSIALQPATDDEQAAAFRSNPKPGDWPEIGEPFWAGVARVEFAMSAMRPALQSVYWTPDGALIAADARRVAHVLPCSAIPKPPTGLRIPDYLLARLGSRRSTVTRLQVSEGAVWCTLKDGSVYAAGYAEAFPLQTALDAIDMTGNALKKNTAKVTIKEEPDRLAVIFANLVRFQKAENVSLSMTAGKASVTFRIQAMDHPSAIEETVAADVKGSTGEVKVDAASFAQALRYIGRSFVFSDSAPAIYFHEQGIEHTLVTYAK